MYLKTLGELSLAQTDLSRPQLLVLLAYLSLEGVKDRRYLADLFYLKTRDPLANLRLALNRIQKDAKDAILVEDNKVSSVVESDIKALLEASTQKAPLKTLRLYEGVFLEGIDTSKLGSELEEWIYASREFIAQQVREALLRLAEESAQQADFNQASQYAEQAYKLAAAPELEPEELKRVHAFLLLTDSPLLSALRKEAADLHLALNEQAEQVKARYQTKNDTKPQETPHNLQTSTTSFVGRSAELLEITQLLKQNARVITLLGMGGVGKTRLSLQVAYEQLKTAGFTEGIYFVALESASSSSDLIVTLNNTLGLALTGQSESLDALVAFIGSKRFLLVLDNFEQLVESSFLLSSLCAQCANLTILVSSREKLGIAEEWLVTVQGLFTPEKLNYAQLNLDNLRGQEAVSLFIQRAKRARLNFDVTLENAEPILNLCQLVQGSPLGIELAAAWVGMLQPKEIVTELQTSLDLLSSHSQHQNERHRSIRAIFETSWAKLSLAEQNLMRKLAVFQSGFTRDAANEVADANIPLLMSLIHKSMLRVDDQGRYDRHPLLYRYSREKLQETQTDYLEARKKHAVYFVELAKKLGPDSYHMSPGPTRQRLMQEKDNLNAVADFAIETQTIDWIAQIFWPIRMFWNYTSNRVQAFKRFQTIMALADMQKAGESQIQLKLGLATSLFDAGDFERAEALYLSCQKDSQKLGLKELERVAIIYLPDFSIARCDFAQARERYKIFEDYLAALGETPFPTDSEAIADYMQGYYKKAEKAFQKALNLAEESHNPWRLSRVYLYLANLQREQRDYKKAAPIYTQSIQTMRTVNEDFRMAIPMREEALMLIYEGKTSKAKKQLERCLALFEGQIAKLDAALCEIYLAEIALQERNVSEAKTLLHKSCISLKQINAKAGVIQALNAITRLLVLTGAYAEALQLGQSLNNIYTELGLSHSKHSKEQLALALRTAQSNTEQLQDSQSQATQLQSYKQCITFALEQSSSSYLTQVGT